MDNKVTNNEETFIPYAIHKRPKDDTERPPNIDDFQDSELWEMMDDFKEWDDLLNELPPCICNDPTKFNALRNVFDLKKKNKPHRPIHRNAMLNTTLNWMSTRSLNMPNDDGDSHDIVTEESSDDEEPEKESEPTEEKWATAEPDESDSDQKEDVIDTKPVQDFKDRVREKLKGIINGKDAAKSTLSDRMEAMSLEAEDIDLKCSRNDDAKDSDDRHTFEGIKAQCPSFKRISIVMEAFRDLHEYQRDGDAVWETVALCEVIQCDEYGHKQLAEDFVHIQSSHIGPDDQEIQRQDAERVFGGTVRESIGQQMARHFMKECPCTDMAVCRAFERHYRVRQPSYAEDVEQGRAQLRKLFRTTNAEDIAFQDECDKIHGYFLQFGLYIERE